MQLAEFGGRLAVSVFTFVEILLREKTPARQPDARSDVLEVTGAAYEWPRMRRKVISNRAVSTR